MSAFKIETNPQKINANIDAIVKTGSKLQVMVHECAVSCLLYAFVHGDVTLMDRLVKSVPAVVRKNAIISWAEKFGPFTYDEEKAKKDKKNETCHFALNKAKRKACMNGNTLNDKGQALKEEAISISPHVFEPEKEFKRYDLIETLKRVQTVAKQRKAQANKEDNIPDEVLEQLAAMLANMEPANRVAA